MNLGIPGAGGGVGEEGQVGGELAPDPGKWTHTDKSIQKPCFYKLFVTEHADRTSLSTVTLFRTKLVDCVHALSG